MTIDEYFQSMARLDKMSDQWSKVFKSMDVVNRFADLASGFGVADFGKMSLAEAMAHNMSESITKMNRNIAASFDFSKYNSQLMNLASAGMQDSFTELAKRLSSISVHPGYVEFPESLIPEDFEYDEVEAETDNDIIAAPSVNEDSTLIKASAISVKKVSINSAIVLICTLIQTLIAILAFCQTNQQERIANALEESNHITVEENELLQEHLETQETNSVSPEQVESLNSGITYLNTILLQLEPYLADASKNQDQSSCDDSESQ